MKKNLLYAISSVFLVLGGVTACNSADAPQQAGFFMKATKNGVSWTAPGSGTFSKTSQEFSLIGQAGDAAKAEVLALGFARPAQAVRSPVRALPAAWRVLLGFDAVTDSYATADSSALPRLEITRLDTVAKIVEGRFEAILVRDKQWQPQGESLRFAEGSFRVQYTNVP